jgi:altronate dehydratase large subunit
MEFYGYIRPDGQVGVRNYIGIIPSVFCANRVAQQIAAQVENTVALSHPLGCSQVGEDLEQTARTLIAMGNHPNLVAVLVVGLGCERFTPDEFVKGIYKSKKPVEKVVIQKEGDTIKAIEKGVRIAKKMVQDFSLQERERVDIGKLVIALKCGGTDATSGIAANPAVGVMTDYVVSNGGTAMFSEVTELLGAEHILARRAANEKAAQDILDTISRMEQKLRKAGSDPRFKHRGALISTGNFDGGVSTVVEKALGGIYKSGSSSISGIVGYAERPGGTGLYLMDSPGHDGEVVTGMVGGGGRW